MADVPATTVPSPLVETKNPAVESAKQAAQEIRAIAVTPWHKDKGLWVAVITGALVPLLNRLLSLDLTPEELLAIVVPFSALIFGHKLKSGAVTVAAIKARTDAAVTSAPVPGTPEEAAKALAGWGAPK